MPERDMIIELLQANTQAMTSGFKELNEKVDSISRRQGDHAGQLGQLETRFNAHLERVEERRVAHEKLEDASRLAMANQFNQVADLTKQVASILASKADTKDVEEINAWRQRFYGWASALSLLGALALALSGVGFASWLNNQQAQVLAQHKLEMLQAISVTTGKPIPGAALASPGAGPVSAP